MSASGRVSRAADTRRRREKLRWWLALYALALAASTLVRALDGDAPEVPPHLAAVELPAYDAHGERDGRVRVAYEAQGAGEPVLLLHGSPGSHADFRGLAPLLADERRTIAPDLPGFGASTEHVPDYSFAAHARYVVALADALGLERFHVVGFSMGGGVGLHVARLAPERVRSLTLVSAIGVVEHEWLGDHHLNHALHGFQLAALWGAREFLPHFGWLDGAFFGVPYARNFYDSDQRPLRGILAGLAMPTLVVHGATDVLVPPAAAREHARIVPHAELHILPDVGHFLVFVEPERVAGPLERFLARVEAGRAPTRADASPARLAAAAQPFRPEPLSGLPLATLMVLLALATLVSEDLTCIGAGALVAQGRLDLLSAAGATFAGIYVGDVTLFLLGRFVGRRALRLPPLKWVVDERDVERAAQWFRHRGLAAVFASRFMPGTRLPTYFAAGALGASTWRFLVTFALAAGVWTPAVVWLASTLGGELLARVEAFRGALPLALAAFVVALLLVLKIGLPMLSWRGRRLLLGRWRRLRHWEFWPTWALYAPIVPYVLWLAFVRHRRPLAFTAANPAIPLGGFVGESKRAILAGLPRDEDGPMVVARWDALPAGLDIDERCARVEAFRARHGLDWPIVLKPDRGERGSGVCIARGADDVRAYLAAVHDDVVVQAFAPGHEYGVFYARAPSEATGRILAVTDKRLPSVVGDGRRTLEELILADERAVAVARYYLRRNAQRLADVPAAGERIAIGELGTHARGAIFLDGSHLATPELLETVDAFSRRYEGFAFGRYDLRAPDADALAAGRSLVVIELNGVTSECTSIYDRRHGVLFAWRTLCAQWALAYRIGVENARRGAPVARWRDFARALGDAWRRRPPAAGG